MGNSQSPLRYPGGKSRFSRLLSTFIRLNGLQDGIYIEPYAGGAGAGLNLLFSEYVDSIVLNDADRMIYLFWKTVLHDTDTFIKLIEKTPVSIDEWQKQRQIFSEKKDASEIDLAFATFYLNRCNRSGIIGGGPIGGMSQNGKWRLNARFNKRELIRRIKRIVDYKSRISVYNLDAILFMKQYVHALCATDNRVIVYIDPPYYSKGNQLYLNYYNAADHLKLSEYIIKQEIFKWIVSYDNVPEVRQLYSDMPIHDVSIYYSAQRKRIGEEVIIFSPDSIIPDVNRLVSPIKR